MLLVYTRPEPPTNTYLYRVGVMLETMLNIQKMARAQNMLLVDLVPLRMRPMETFLWRGMIVGHILGVHIFSDSSAHQLKHACTHAKNTVRFMREGSKY